MSKNHVYPFIFMVIFLVITAFSVSFGWPQNSFAGDKKDSEYLLRYGIRGEKHWRYTVLSDKITEFNISKIGMDLSSKTILKKDYSLSFISSDADQHLKMAVKVNDMSSVTHSSTGQTHIDFSKVKGKTFHSIVTDLGEAVKFTGVAHLKARNEKRSGQILQIGIENFFSPILLALPEKPIKIGDTWQSESSNTTLNEDGIEETVVYKLQCVFDGVEKINEKECLRIKTFLTGSVTGAGTGNNALDNSYSEFYGKFKGHGTAYLDPDGVVLLKYEKTNVTEGELTLRSNLGQYTEPIKTVKTVTMSLVEQ